MTTTAAVVLAAALLWLFLPMDGFRPRDCWHRKEYWLSIALIGLSGVGILIGILQPSNPLIDLLRIAVPIAAALIVVLANVVEGAHVRASGFLLTCVFAPMAAFAISERLAMPMMSLALLAPAVVVPKSGYSVEPLFAGLRDSIRVVLIALILCVVVRSDTMIGACRDDKCSVWGAALGPLGAGNAFGVYVSVIAGIALMLARNRWSAIFALLASAALVDATSSRSGLLSWVCIVVAATTWRWFRPRVGVFILKAINVGIIGLISFFGFYPWNLQDFTGRANLWAVAREVIAESPWFGLGPSFWVRQDRTSYVVSNYATHNLLLEVLVSVGIVGAMALSVCIVLLIKAADQRLKGAVLVLIAAWMGSSVLEVTAAPGRVYLLPGVLVLIFLCAQSNFRDSGALDDAVTSASTTPAFTSAKKSLGASSKPSRSMKCEQA